MNAILWDYRLPLYGDHGIAHWARVRDIGLKLAPLTGADTLVVELFSVFHDSRRVNENTDVGHGLRGAELMRQLRDSFFNVTNDQFRLLYDACALHTDGLTEGEVTVQTCWDSDRLDLMRVGITPETQYLCTDAAKEPEMIDWACERAFKGFRPAVASQWEKSLLQKT